MSSVFYPASSSHLNIVVDACAGPYQSHSVNAITYLIVASHKQRKVVYAHIEVVAAFLVLNFFGFLDITLE